MKKKTKMIAVIAIILVVALVGGGLLYFFALRPIQLEATYNNALDKWNDGDHLRSAIKFNSIGNYKDSKDYVDLFVEDVDSQIQLTKWETEKVNNEEFDGFRYLTILDDGTASSGSYGWDKKHYSEKKDFAGDYSPYEITFKQGKVYLVVSETYEEYNRTIKSDFEIVYTDGEVSAFLQEASIWGEKKVWDYGHEHYPIKKEKKKSVKP